MRTEQQYTFAWLDADCHSECGNPTTADCASKIQAAASPASTPAPTPAAAPTHRSVSSLRVANQSVRERTNLAYRSAFFESTCTFRPAQAGVRMRSMAAGHALPPVAAPSAANPAHCRKANMEAVDSRLSYDCFDEDPQQAPQPQLQRSSQYSPKVSEEARRTGYGWPPVPPRAARQNRGVSLDSGADKSLLHHGRMHNPLSGAQVRAACALGASGPHAQQLLRAETVQAPVSRVPPFDDARNASAPGELSWQEAHPSALSPALFSRLEGKRVVVFLDYDGTLTPIVRNPDEATLSAGMRDIVHAVSEQFPTAIVSGRGRAKVQAFVDLPALFYAGSHGLDIIGPTGRDGGTTPSWVREVSDGTMAAMHVARERVTEAVQHIPGASVEDNKYCFSVHFRNCAAADWDEVKEIVERMAEENDLRVTRGRKVLEIRPKVEWDKGRALLHLLDAYDLGTAADVLPIYIGDDTTDEDAFKVLRSRGGLPGIGILVSKVAKPTAASYSLQGPHEVQDFLAGLVHWGATSAGNGWLPSPACIGWSAVYAAADSLAPQGSAATQTASHTVTTTLASSSTAASSDGADGRDSWEQLCTYESGAGTSCAELVVRDGCTAAQLDSGLRSPSSASTAASAATSEAASGPASPVAHGRQACYSHAQAPEAPTCLAMLHIAERPGRGSSAAECGVGGGGAAGGAGDEVDSLHVLSVQELVGQRGASGSLLAEGDGPAAETSPLQEEGGTLHKGLQCTSADAQGAAATGTCVDGALSGGCA